MGEYIPKEHLGHSAFTKFILFLAGLTVCVAGYLTYDRVFATRLSPHARYNQHFQHHSPVPMGGFSLDPAQRQRGMTTNYNILADRQDETIDYYETNNGIQ